ncbi:hypothetical protein [Flavobacterium adhaerens]|uniref:hypothetical protein n=1 Tax=Flavobacterium adhaerens TaxID=3149043 RepID=UPI0032B3BEE3
MKNNYLPKTRIELENWMKENCYNFDSYSINGNSIYEGYEIQKKEDFYIWYFTERGKKQKIRHFKTESEIVAYAFGQISSDKWAEIHCIGFSSDQDKITELKNILLKMNITYFEDQIPYYGIDKPVFRIFVSGCDIQPTTHLKEKYWTEK